MNNDLNTGPARHIDEKEKSEKEEYKRSGIVRPEEEKSFTEGQEELYEYPGEEAPDNEDPAEAQEDDLGEYRYKAKQRFSELEPADDKRRLINWEKKLGFQRRNEGFMKVSYIGPDAKTGQAKLMFLYGYGSLQSSVLYLHAVYSTGFIPVGYHTFDLKNGYNIEWYSEDRYFNEAGRIEKDIEHYQSEEGRAEEEKKAKDAQEQIHKDLELKKLEKKAEQYDELESKGLVKFLKLIRFIK